MYEREVHKRSKTFLRAESESVISPQVGVTSEEGVAGEFIVSVCVGAGAVVLEVAVELNARGRAGLGGVVRSGAAVSRVF